MEAGIIQETHKIVLTLEPFQNATAEDEESYVAWHSWGLANFYCIKHFDGGSQNANDVRMETTYNSGPQCPLKRALIRN